MIFKLTFKLGLVLRKDGMHGLPSTHCGAMNSCARDHMECAIKPKKTVESSAVKEGNCIPNAETEDIHTIGEVRILKQT